MSAKPASTYPPMRGVYAELFTLFQLIISRIKPAYRNDVVIDVDSSGEVKIDHIGDTADNYMDPEGNCLIRWRDPNEGVMQLGRLAAFCNANVYRPDDEWLHDRVGKMQPELITAYHPEAEAFDALAKLFHRWVAQEPGKRGSADLVVHADGTAVLRAYDYETRVIGSMAEPEDLFRRLMAIEEEGPEAPALPAPLPTITVAMVAAYLEANGFIAGQPTEGVTHYRHPTRGAAILFPQEHAKGPEFVELTLRNLYAEGTHPGEVEDAIVRFAADAQKLAVVARYLAAGYAAMGWNLQSFIGYGEVAQRAALIVGHRTTMSPQLGTFVEVADNGFIAYAIGTTVQTTSNPDGLTDDDIGEFLQGWAAAETVIKHQVEKRIDGAFGSVGEALTRESLIIIGDGLADEA